MDQIIEGSGKTLNVTFKNPDGTVRTPSKVSYRIDCETTRQEVKAKVDASPIGATTSIYLSPTDNTRKGTNNSFERKKVTVVAQFASDPTQQATGVYYYNLQMANLA